jgi:uncharacterized protein YjbI with pentapeptide repeats
VPARSVALLRPRLARDLAAVESGDLVDDLDWDGVEVAGDFSGQMGRAMEITGSRISGARFTGSNLDRVRIRDTVIESCDLSGARLVEAALVRVEFRVCRMSAIDLAGARLSDVLFTETKLDHANFSMASGERVRFDHAHLEASSFYAAKVADAQFFDCDLTATELSKSDLPGVRLHGSTLEGLKGAGDLHGAVIDSGQVLPMALGVFGALGIEIDDDREAP